METNTEAAAALAARLLQLRADSGLSQPQLAGALEVSVPLISSWESRRAPVTPPEARLTAYARFFAVSDRGRPSDGELTPVELARFRELDAELRAMRDAATGRHDSFVNQLRKADSSWPWRFPEGEVVTVVCAGMPADQRPRASDPRDPDYIAAYQYADLDALFELYGHIRAVNPDSTVNIRVADAMSDEDLSAHLVLLGGVDWNPVAAEILTVASPQVRQVGRPEEEDIGAFEVVATGQTFAPKLTPDGRLAQDVGHFLRVPNPLNADRVLIACNGMYGRGVYGVVKALTDLRRRDRNAAYLAERFSGSTKVSILCRVRLLAGAVVVPDWTQSDNRLHEWPEGAG